MRVVMHVKAVLLAVVVAMVVVAHAPYAAPASPPAPMAAASTAAAASPLAQTAVRFMEWFRAKGGIATNVDLRAVPSESGDGSKRFGIVATEPVEEGDVVITVPIDIVIWRDTILSSVANSRPRGRKSKAGSSAKRLRSLYAKIRSEEDLLALFLIRERALGKSSAWAPYIEVLPKELPLPVFYSRAELEALQDDRAASYASGMIEQYHMQFDYMRSTIHGLLKPLGKAAVAVFCTPSMYQWAVTVVGSRAMHLQGERYLVPMADMFNYKPAANFREARDGMHFLRHHRRNDDSFEVLADRNTASGSQLYEDFGDNSNYVYLNHHGFVPLVNPFDCVELPLPSLDDSPPPTADVAARKTLLKRLRLQPPLTSCLRPGPLPSDVQQYLTLWGMDAARIKHCTDSLRTADGPPADSTRWACLGRELPTASYMQLGTIVAEKLRAYPTSIMQDQAMLAASAARNSGARNLLPFRLKLSRNERLAVQFRLSRKRLLKDMQQHYAMLGNIQSGEACSADSGVCAATSAASSTAAKAAEASTSLRLPQQPKAGAAVAHSLAVRKAKLYHAVGRFNEWLRAGGKGGAGLVRGGLIAAVMDSQPTDGHSSSSKGIPDSGTGMPRVAVVAQNGLHEGELVAVSMHAVMDSHTARRTLPLDQSVWGTIMRASHEVQSMASRMPQDWFEPKEQALALHLIAELASLQSSSANGTVDDMTGSRWHHWLALLPGPDEMPSPLLFEPPELAALRGSSVVTRVLERRLLLTEHYRHLQRHVFAQFPSRFPTSVFSLRRYLWARAVLDARGHWWDGERHFVPLLDLVVLEPPLQMEPLREERLQMSADRAVHEYLESVDETGSSTGGSSAVPTAGVEAGGGGGGGGGDGATLEEAGEGGADETRARVASAQHEHSRQLYRHQRIRMLRRANKPVLRPDSTGDWVLSTAWRAVVGGERLLTPSTTALPRHELFLYHSVSPQAIGGAEQATIYDDGSIDGIRECLFVQLLLDARSPNIEVQASRLWHHGEYNTRILTCIHLSSLVEDACLASSSCSSALVFVKAAAGLQSYGSAWRCLLRLLLRWHDAGQTLLPPSQQASTTTTEASAGGAEGSLGSHTRMAAALAHRRAEIAFLHQLETWVSARAPDDHISESVGEGSREATDAQEGVPADAVCLDAGLDHNSELEVGPQNNICIVCQDLDAAAPPPPTFAV